MKKTLLIIGLFCFVASPSKNIEAANNKDKNTLTIKKLKVDVPPEKKPAAILAYEKYRDTLVKAKSWDEIDSFFARKWIEEQKANKVKYESMLSFFAMVGKVKTEGYSSIDINNDGARFKRIISNEKGTSWTLIKMINEMGEWRMMGEGFPEDEWDKPLKPKAKK